MMRTVLVSVFLLLMTSGSAGWGVVRLTLGYDDTMTQLNGKTVSEEDMRQLMLSYGKNLSQKMEIAAGVTVQLVEVFHIESHPHNPSENMDAYYNRMTDVLEFVSDSDFLIALTTHAGALYFAGDEKACADWILLSVAKGNTGQRISDSSIVKWMSNLLLAILGVHPNNKDCTPNATYIPPCAKQYIRDNEPECMKTHVDASETIRGGEVCGNGLQEQGEVCDCKFEDGGCRKCCNMIDCKSLQPGTGCAPPPLAPTGTTKKPTARPTRKKKKKPKKTRRPESEAATTSSPKSSGMSTVTIFLISISVVMIFLIIVVVFLVFKTVPVLSMSASTKSSRTGNMVRTSSGRLQSLPPAEADDGRRQAHKLKPLKATRSLSGKRVRKASSESE